MEIGLIALIVFLERLRPDLVVRRWWSRLPVPRPELSLAVPAPVALAGVDARRLAVRLTMVGLAFVLYKIFWEGLPAESAYDGVNHLVGFYLALLGLLVMAIVATTGGRDRGEDLIDALPRGPRTRILGWAVLLAGLALLEYVLLVALRFGRDEPAYAALLPDAWDLAQGPLMLLGGGLLGLLLARLVPAWVAAPVAIVLSVAWVATFSGADWAPNMLAPMYEWIQYHEDDRIIVEAGSFAWHNAYLLGLCGLALVAALLREPGRRRTLVLSGTAILVATVVAGALALP